MRKGKSECDNRCPRPNQVASSGKGWPSLNLFAFVSWLTARQWHKKLLLDDKNALNCENYLLIHWFLISVRGTRRWKIRLKLGKRLSSNTGLNQVHSPRAFVVFGWSTHPGCVAWHYPRRGLEVDHGLSDCQRGRITEMRDRRRQK